MLKQEELSALKRQNPARALAFDVSDTIRGQVNVYTENPKKNVQVSEEALHGSDLKGSQEVSTKQVYCTTGILNSKVVEGSLVA